MRLELLQMYQGTVFIKLEFLLPSIMLAQFFAQSVTFCLSYITTFRNMHQSSYIDKQRTTNSKQWEKRDGKKWVMKDKIKRM